MIISVICPVLNEEDHIENILRFFIESSPLEKELFVIDGGSVDNTRNIVVEWMQKNVNIHLLDNPKKYVSYALNMAIPKCRGDYIVRLDAHTDYTINYFEKILEVFKNTNADIVGGAYRTKYIGYIQAAIATVISSKFGIGNSLVHQIDYDGDSDSVAFGAWRREIFSKTGLFDTRLIRNQDDEFHYRAKSMGLRIYQSSQIHLYYYPRNDLKKLFSQYYEYGLYKPRVLWKVPKEAKLRHIIPGLFVFYLLTFLFIGQYHSLFYLPLVFYIALLFCFSLINKLPLKSKFIVFIAYPTIHIAYGLGFWIGMLFYKR